MDSLRIAAVAVRFGMRASPLRLLCYLVLALITGMVPVMLAWFTKMLLDRLGGTATHNLTLLAFAVAGTGLLGALIPHLSRYLMAEYSRAVSLATQDRLYAKVNTFNGLRNFENPEFHNQLRVAQHTGSAAPVRVADSAINLCRTFITTAAFLGSLWTISPPITLVVLVSAIPMLIGEVRLARQRADAFVNISSRERREVFYAGLLANLQAAKEIRLFGIGDLLRTRMRVVRKEADAMRRSLDRRTVSLEGGLGLLAMLVSGGGLVWIVIRAGRGELTVGDVAMFLAAIAGVQGGLSSAATSIAFAHQDLLNFRRYLEVLDTPADLPEPAKTVALPPLRRGIELRDVWFRYSPDRPWILRGVNLFIPHGTSLGLVGRNGAGKSTLVKLICRFYDPERGAILWDGVDVRDVPIAQLRQRLSAVFQDYMHYDLSARENIGIGDLDRLDDLDAVRASARLAGIDDKISALSDGYETALTRLFLSSSGKDDGVLLSGGEWQRVALARSFMRKEPELLILDEPSSGLDAAAEYEVHQRLREHRSDRTSLLISHRLGTLRDADMIVVLADGVIIEQGRHDSLIHAEGEYAELFRMQANGYQLDTAAAAPAGFVLR
ncbi:ABC transporter ATP-binding protein [Catelliglobosispora koreensis]|uniref:ABC transporter ATP-binding protein n=1 Tax=Catelliglobosispora koreensis TaxID=129052 RepID=UPI000476E6BA|nr:ABC transporter ATP-binding protein [Catelliglobosispora koreensis]